jgi:hypothetical protein
MEKNSNKVDLEALLTIQSEMLVESKRLRQLTVWLIALTAALMGVSMVTLVGVA